MWFTTKLHQQKPEVSFIYAKNPMPRAGNHNIKEAASPDLFVE
jgi:hypothetical protein